MYIKGTSSIALRLCGIRCYLAALMRHDMISSSVGRAYDGFFARASLIFNPANKRKPRPKPGLATLPKYIRRASSMIQLTPSASATSSPHR
jgi:hypothetical protein